MLLCDASVGGSSYHFETVSELSRIRYWECRRGRITNFVILNQ